jgi:hypothetical protein
MDQWQCKEVGDGVAAFQPAMELHKAFLEVAVASGHVDPGFGVFSSHDLSENMVTWYFSPEAAALATRFGASPCDKPTPSPGFSLLAGEGRSWEIHWLGYIASRRRR